VQFDGIVGTHDIVAVLTAFPLAEQHFSTLCHGDFGLPELDSVATELERRYAQHPDRLRMMTPANSQSSAAQRGARLSLDHRVSTSSGLARLMASMQCAFL